MNRHDAGAVGQHPLVHRGEILERRRRCGGHLAGGEQIGIEPAEVPFRIELTPRPIAEVVVQRDLLDAEALDQRRRQVHRAVGDDRD